MSEVDVEEVEYSLDDLMKNAKIGFEDALDNISTCIYRKDFESVLRLPEGFIIEGLTYNEMYNKLLGYYSFQLTVLEDAYNGDKGLRKFLKESQSLYEKYSKLITDRLLEVELILPSYVH